MSSPEDIGAAARDAAQVYGAEQYAAGATSRQPEVDALKAQETADVATIAGLRTTNAGLLAANLAIQAELDAYKRTHPDPTPAGPLIGMNFEPPGTIATVNANYENLADAARIYVTAGQTDIRNEPEFVRAYAAGVRVYVFSSKDTDKVPAWYGTVPADCVWYGINHHEPEDDIAKGNFTLADWHDWQALHLPAVASHGGIPAVCFMSYTVNPVSGRHISDYALPAGMVKVAFWDYYPNKEPKPTQATTVDRIKTATVALGIPDYGIGEYGILHASTVYTAATVTEFHGLTQDAVVKLYWSNRQKEDQTFTEQTASAWFA